MQTKPRRWLWLFAGTFCGIALSFIAIRVVDALMRRDDTLRRFTADVDLDALYAYKYLDGTNSRNVPLSGKLKAGSEFRIRMKKGSMSYLELHTVIPTASLEQVSKAAPTR